MTNTIFAKGFAYGAHAGVGQKRKYTGEHYIAHCEAVAALIESVEHTDDMVCAAWLHDVVEDTNVTIHDIYNWFGEDIALMVEGLTDISVPEDGNRRDRKAIDRNWLSRQCADVQTIKLADIIANSRDIVEHDPEFAKVYMAEKRELLTVLTKGDKRLHAMASAIVDRYYAKKGGLNHEDHP